MADEGDQVSLRRRLQSLQKTASEGAVIIHQRDGSLRAFDRMTVSAAVFLHRLDQALGREPRRSEVMDALANATEESRREVEGQVGGKFLSDLEDSPPEPEPVPDLSE